MYQTTKHPVGTASCQPRQLILHTHFNVFHRLFDIPNKLIIQFIFFFQKIRLMRLLLCVCVCVCVCVSLKLFNQLIYIHRTWFVNGSETHAVLLGIFTISKNSTAAIQKNSSVALKNRETTRIHASVTTQKWTGQYTGCPRWKGQYSGRS